MSAGLHGSRVHRRHSLVLLLCSVALLGAATCWVVGAFAAPVVSTATYAPGDLDPAFGSGGAVTHSFFTGEYTFVTSLAQQTDGKLVVAGASRNGNSQTGKWTWAVSRFLANGSRDTGFGSGGTATAWGRVITNTGSQAANDVAVQPDGKIVAAGATPTNNGDFAVARWNANGSVDTTFGSKKSGRVSTDIEGRSIDGAFGVAIQADGKIVVCGGSSSGGAALVRYTATGALDTTFGNGGKVVGTPAGAGWFARVRILPSGQILVAGRGSESLAGFSSSGGLVFNTPISAGAISDILPLPDGRILVCGAVDDGNYGFVARVNGGGGLDTSFGAAGVAGPLFLTTSTDRSSLAVQADGKILFACDTGTARLHPNGDYDRTFGTNGVAPPGSAEKEGVAIAAGGGIVRLSSYAPGNSPAIFLYKHLPDDAALLTAPDPVAAGETLALGVGANHALNGAIQDVVFWVDVDGDGSLDNAIDLDLGAGIENAGVWELSGLVSWPAGTHTYFAVVGYASGETVIATQGEVE